MKLWVTTGDDVETRADNYVPIIKQGGLGVIVLMS